MGGVLVCFVFKLMKGLMVVGIVVMFLVGGGIVVYNVFVVYYIFELMFDVVYVWLVVGILMLILMNGVIGVVVGSFLVVVMEVWYKVCG